MVPRERDPILYAHPIAREGSGEAPWIGPVRREYSCPWFNVAVKDVRLSSDRRTEAFYTVEINDWAAVLAVVEDGRIPLIRQYRPAVERFLFELPAGAIREGERPEEVALRELLEEAGCKADELVPLGTVYPDSGRLTSRAWTYFAPAARVVSAPKPHANELLDLVFVHPEELGELMAAGEFASAGHLAAVSLALLGNEIAL